MVSGARNPALSAALTALAAAVFIAVPARTAPAVNSQVLPHERSAIRAPAPQAADPDGRLRSIVALIEQTRARAAAPGLRDEERDALADLAWAQADEALEDPFLRERDDPDRWWQLARSWERVGESERAREAWREVVRIDPSDDEAAEKLGVKP